MVLFDEVEKAHADVFNILLQASLSWRLLPLQPLDPVGHACGLALTCRLSGC